MRVFKPNVLKNAGLQAPESVFLENWYAMTHKYTLDSYRVRCLNARIAVRELAEELRIGRLSDTELSLLCQETARILEEDPLIKNTFPVNESVVRSFLKTPPQAGDKRTREDRNNSRDWQKFRYAVEDFSAELEKRYFKKITETLQASIKPENEKQIIQITGSLLSDLVDRGWSLESLFRWHKHFLKPNQARTFSQNINFMLRQLSGENSGYQVTLRLSGTDRLKAIGKFHDFDLTERVDPVGGGIDDAPFLQTNAQLTFASTEIQAADDESAALQARSAAEQLLDLLRFDYVPRAIQIEDKCRVLRKSDSRASFVHIQNSVPNPPEAITEDGFLRFAENVDAVTAKQYVSENSRAQLQAALRQYRFGGDSHGYKDKFMNWWMGLEALCNVGNGKSIGETVMLNASYAMSNKYLFWLLRDMSTTLKYLAIPWPEALQSTSGSSTLNALTVAQLLNVLQHSPACDQLWDLCKENPVVAFRGKELAEVLAKPQNTLSRLQRHLEHMKWHINRLYRVRCCIVHGSPIRFKLGLMAANLEFYLKETIRLAIATFLENEHIHTLENLFERSCITYNRVTERLKSNTADPRTIREAVFADVVTRDI